MITITPHLKKIEAINELIDSGIALLNEKAPGWYNEINLDTFDVRFGDKCVLGQVFATNDWEDSLAALELTPDQGGEYGFIGTYIADTYVDSATFTPYWKAKIEKLQKEGVV